MGTADTEKHRLYACEICAEGWELSLENYSAMLPFITYIHVGNVSS